MNFREFVLLTENRFYYAYLDKDGHYHVNSHFFTTASERNRELYDIKQEFTPVKMWAFSVNPGDYQFKIPGATPKEKEQIALAYYARMGLNVHAHHSFGGNTQGDYIDSKYFDPNYTNTPSPLGSTGSYKST